jgi:hypothetical protein
MGGLDGSTEKLEIVIMVKRIIPGFGEEFLQREGLKPEIAVWEDGLRTDTRPGSFEWWYFDAHFEDGSTEVMVYATKPLRLRSDSLTPMVTLTITRLYQGVNSNIVIRKLQPHESALYSSIRLACLINEPDYFGSTY